MRKILTALLPLITLIGFFPEAAWAAEEMVEHLDLTTHKVGIASLIIFVVAYGFVMAEEFTQLRKSKPVLLAAGIIWAMIAMVYANNGLPHAAEHAIRHNILEFSELFLFLLVAMTYINSMDERLVFDSLRAWLVRPAFRTASSSGSPGCSPFSSPRWPTTSRPRCSCAPWCWRWARTIPAFVVHRLHQYRGGRQCRRCLQPVRRHHYADGMAEGDRRFLDLLPAVRPFRGQLVVPAAIMHFAVPDERPPASGEVVVMKRGAKRVIFLFLCTIATAVSFHNFLHLPPMVGMMTGLAYLKIFGYYLKKTFDPQAAYERRKTDYNQLQIGDIVPFDIFRNIARSEWDTLMFFYGVIICVGGLGFIGYLALASEVMYVAVGGHHGQRDGGYSVGHRGQHSGHVRRA